MPGHTLFSDRDLPLSIVHDYSINRETKLIYMCVILLSIMMLGSLAFIDMPFNMTTKVNNLRGPKYYVLEAPVSGTILKVLKNESAPVVSGDTILLIQAD